VASLSSLAVTTTSPFVLRDRYRRSDSGIMERQITPVFSGRKILRSDVLTIDQQLLSNRKQRGEAPVNGQRRSVAE
jgi:hypothetical protein